MEKFEKEAEKVLKEAYRNGGILPMETVPDNIKLILLRYGSHIKDIHKGFVYVLNDDAVDYFKVTKENKKSRRISYISITVAVFAVIASALALVLQYNQEHQNKINKSQNSKYDYRNHESER